MSELPGVLAPYQRIDTTIEAPSQYSKCALPLLASFTDLINITIVLAVGCGSYQPIDTYATNASSVYPIYTDPTRRIHTILDFNSNLATEKAGEEKRDYMRDMGGSLARYWGGLKGALGSLQYTAYVGPKSLNGGELVISAGKLSDMKSIRRELTMGRRRVRVYIPHADYGGSHQCVGPCSSHRCRLHAERSG